MFDPLDTLYPVEFVGGSHDGTRVVFYSPPAQLVEGPMDRVEFYVDTGRTVRHDDVTYHLFALSTHPSTM